MPRRGGAKSEGPSFEDYIEPLSLEEFKDTYWGKKAFASTLQDDILERMRDGFYEGDISELAQTCR